jgi:hypothetical protein
MKKSMVVQSATLLKYFVIYWLSAVVFLWKHH